MIAVMQARRNCLCLEKDALLFINSKIHAIDVLNKSVDNDEQAQASRCYFGTLI